MILLRTMAGIVFIIPLSILFLCCSTQARQTPPQFTPDVAYDLSKLSSSSKLPTTSSSLSISDQESQVAPDDRWASLGRQNTMQPRMSLQTSPPDVRPTASDRVASTNIPKEASSATVTGADDATRGGTGRPQASQTWPTTVACDRTQGAGLLGTRVLSKVVCLLRQGLTRHASRSRVPAATSSSGFASSAGPIQHMPVVASDGEQRRFGRSLLRDISPPGMWPITSDDDELESVGGRSLLSAHSTGDGNETIFDRAGARSQNRVGRSLLRDISPPGMWPVGSDDDEFQTSRRRALLADQSSPDVELHNFHGRSLLRDISPPGMWPVTSDDDEFADSSGHSRMLLSTDSSGSRSADPLQHEGALVHDISAPGKWPITSDAERRSTRHHHGRALLRDISPPGMWPSSDDDEFEFARRRALLAHAKTTADSPDPAGDGQTRKHRRALLRDISPPGMWLDSDDDDESEVSGGRMLLSSPEQSEGGSHKSRRALLRDISPPGMWPTSDDDEFEVSRRRALLSDNAQLSPVQSSKTNRERKHEQVLLRDSSPPQMWPISSAGDQSGVNRGRSLLSGRPHSSSAHAIKNEHPHQHRRALLRDISPPGMWPITSDDEAIEIARRRSLLSDGTFSSSVWASTDHQHGGRRALLRDISPPGMWPVGSDDDEFQVNRRRALLSDKSYSSSAKSSSIQHGRALLGDISPPGMWPITAADDRDILVRK